MKNQCCVHTKWRKNLIGIFEVKMSTSHLPFALWAAVPVSAAPLWPSGPEDSGIWFLLTWPPCQCAAAEPLCPAFPLVSLHGKCRSAGPAAPAEAGVRNGEKEFCYKTLYSCMYVVLYLSERLGGLLSLSLQLLLSCVSLIQSLPEVLPLCHQLIPFFCQLLNLSKEFTERSRRWRQVSSISGCDFEDSPVLVSVIVSLLCEFGNLLFQDPDGLTVLLFSVVGSIHHFPGFIQLLS